jgi:hypothetical protein
VKLTKDQYDKLKPHLGIIKHISNGGSARVSPLYEVLAVWKEAGGQGINEFCEGCRSQLFKDIQILIDNYNGST